MPLKHIPNPCPPIPLGQFLLEDTRFPAVYFLICRNDVVYVGQSKTLRHRIDGHLTEGIKTFDQVAYIRCMIDQLIDLESHYIRTLAPKYNSCRIANKARERAAWSADRDRRRSAIVGTGASGCDAATIQTIDAHECTIPASDLGEFFQVADRDVTEWIKAGELKDCSIVGLLNYVAAHHVQVGAAQARFEAL